MVVEPAHRIGAATHERARLEVTNVFGHSVAAEATDLVLVYELRVPSRLLFILIYRCQERLEVAHW